MALPWERQDDETEPAFEAFQVYRDLGLERSQVKTAQAVGKDPSLMARWSTEHNWVTRCVSYDRHLDDVRRAAHAEEVEKMAARHAQSAQILQGAAVTELAKLRKEQAKLGGEDGPMMLSPELVLRFLDVGAKIERVARGEPETINAFDLHGGDPLVRGIATDEGVRDAARELVERAARAREEQSRRLGPGDES